jgi:hypothetical protein
LDALQLVMELGIPFAKIVTHRIYVIYLDQAKLKASGWCVGVMYWTDLESCFSIKIRSKKTLIPPLVLMILILNPERIVYSDVKCRSLWCIYGCDQIDGQHTRCVGWSQLTLWESLESKSFLKMIRNFSLRLILWIGLF